MRKFLIGLLAVCLLLFAGCKENNPPVDELTQGTVEGIEFEEKEITLIVGQKAVLKYEINPAITGTLRWKSSDEKIAYVDKGVVTAEGISTGGSTRFANGYATGSATITVTTADGKYSDTITVNTTTQPSVNIMDLPPFKEQFKDYFLMGNIFDPENETNATTITPAHLTHHYNVLTAQNDMKPGYLVSSRSGTNINLNTTRIATAKRMVDAALANNIKVVGHTLLWHEQNGSWIGSLGDATQATNIMKAYITAVMTEFKGKIYVWDVLNEAFPDDASSSANWKDAIRSNNPWYSAIGSDFVYEAFLAAREADPAAILYYNDYNTNFQPRKRLIRDMVKDVNDKYKQEYPAETRLLIEGIGMQEHHNLSVGASSIRETINMFRALGVELAVSELDVCGNENYNAFVAAGGQGINKHTTSPVTNTQIITQADRYEEYIKVYIENKDIIKRVSLWGVTDNSSWRSVGWPLLFDHKGNAKPAYYRFVGVLED